MPEDAEVWSYGLADAVGRGWGLAVRCVGCGRERRWSDQDLMERFQDSLALKVAALRPALSCPCGARGPRLYFYQARSLDIGARAASARAAAGVGDAGVGRTRPRRTSPAKVERGKPD